MSYSVTDAKQRLVRYGDLIPCKTAFIDARTPGSDQKENFTIIGPGVAENPEQHIHVRIPHGFNIGGARQPKGCVNSQHSHISEEVFLVHSGNWKFTWGETGEDGDIVLGAGDVISIPINVFRGFECVSDEPGFLFAILGGDDPGRVTWAPYVFEQAAHYGLVLLQSGRLVDLQANDTIPADDSPHPPTTAEEAAAIRRMKFDEMRECVTLQQDYQFSEQTTLAIHSEGVSEAPILGPANEVELISAGRVASPHGFVFRRLEFTPRGSIPLHSRAEEEVLFVHKGVILLEWDGETLELREGDTFTTPIGMEHALREAVGNAASVFVVRRGNKPAPPHWSSGATTSVSGVQ